MKAMATMIRAGLVFLLMVAVLSVSGRVAAADATEPPKKEAVSADRVAKLIRQLGDKDYFVRQRAEDELARLGFEAFDALNAATTDDDLEIAARAKYLLRLMRVEWTAESDPPEVKSCLHDYESADRECARASGCRRWPPCPTDKARRPCAGWCGSRGCRCCREGGAGVDPQSGRGPIRPTPPRSPRSARCWTRASGPAALWLLAWARLGSEPDAAHGRVDEAGRRRSWVCCSRRRWRPAPRSRPI